MPPNVPHLPFSDKKDYAGGELSNASTTADENSSKDCGTTEGSTSERMREWDISRGQRQVSALDKMTMVLPSLTRALGTSFGGLFVAQAFMVGKVGECMGFGKAVDSNYFRSSFALWMRMSGIFPQVEYDPLGDAGVALADFYGFSDVPSDDDMNITPVIVSNHICYLDGMILASLIGAPKVVAMASSREVPIMGKLMEELETVFVERGEQGSRQSALDAISDHCQTWSRGKRPLLMFPEGTTTNGEGLIEFKKGAFVAGKPVRPLLIVYTGAFDPATTTYMETQEGITKTSDVEWLGQMMGALMHSLHVRVLPPYVPNEAERNDPTLFSRNVHAQMDASLAELRSKLTDNSWKKAAGRDVGGLGFEFGDVFRVTARNLLPLSSGMGSEMWLTS